MKDSVVANFATTATDGKTYQVEYFNLDAIISVGYRVNSKRGSEFRRWASQILKDHLVQGYTINHNRLNSTRIKEIQNTIDLLSTTLIKHELVSDIGTEIFNIGHDSTDGGTWFT